MEGEQARTGFDARCTKRKIAPVLFGAVAKCDMRWKEVMKIDNLSQDHR